MSSISAFWTRRQGKVPLGRPGNHASQHALCEWQEEGVTEWELCVNGHLVSFKALKLFLFISSAKMYDSFPRVFTVRKQHYYYHYIVHAVDSAQLLCPNRMERLKDMLQLACSSHVQILILDVQIFCDYNCDIIFAVEGNEQDKWLPWLVTAVAACVHFVPLCACSSETLWECVSSLEKTCMSLCMCPENVSLLSLLNKCRIWK